MKTVQRSLGIALLSAGVFAFSSRAHADDRIYSVIEYLASQDQLKTVETRVQGKAECQNEDYCTLIEDAAANRTIPFTADGLPEADRIALVKSGAVGPVREAIVTLKVVRAIKVEFIPGH